MSPWLLHMDGELVAVVLPADAGDAHRLALSACGGELSAVTQETAEKIRARTGIGEIAYAPAHDTDEDEGAEQRRETLSITHPGEGRDHDDEA